MKESLIKLFWPILRFFETGEEATNYKESHRIILIVVGVLFILLSMISMSFSYSSGEVGALIPIVVFFSVGAVAIVVGTLGSDSAVQKIWGRK